MRPMSVFVAWNLMAAVGALGQTPGDATIREKVVVREVPVLADVPASWRGEPVPRLAERMIALEDGAAREISALQPVAAPAGPGYARVEVAFDAAHCRPELARGAALALAGQAERLVALGPVGISAWTGSGTLAPVPPTREAAALAANLTARAPAACASLASEQPEHELVCPATPCLMIWVAAEWGSAADAEADLAAADATARALAAGGWTVLAFAPVAPSAPAVHARKPETRPGDDRSSWTINLLDPHSGEERDRAQSEAEGATDPGLAPLCRVVAATAGELVASTDALAGGLAAIRGRSLLYYRTDRAPGGAPVRFELRESGEGGRRLRAVEWAPALRP